MKRWGVLRVLGRRGVTCLKFYIWCGRVFQETLRRINRNTEGEIILLSTSFIILLLLLLPYNQ